MKKRLDLASALVHKPRVLFLDEPTTGLDPQSRVAIWEHLETLNSDEGVTVFLTTQQMEEADRLCHRLSIIDHGEIVVSGPPVELKHQLGGDTITLSLANGDGGVKDRSKRIVSGIQVDPKSPRYRNGTGGIRKECERSRSRYRTAI